MENARILPFHWENQASVRVTMMEVDSAASEECDAQMHGNVYPSKVMQEPKALMEGVGLLKNPLPFRERNMEEGRNAASVKVNMMVVDPAAKRKGRNEDNGAVVNNLSTPTASKECDTKMDENLSPSEVMQENKAPIMKSPMTGMGLLKKPRPFRERNFEEGKRLLPPYIKVPPKKMFGYRSPTDAMVSPVSRGLLTRNRRPSRTLSPMVPPKALENSFQHVVVDVAGGASRSNEVRLEILDAVKYQNEETTGST